MTPASFPPIKTSPRARKKTRQGQLAGILRGGNSTIYPIRASRVSAMSAGVGATAIPASSIAAILAAAVPFAAADDSARVTHPASGGRGGSRDESGDRLFAVLFSPSGGLLLRAPADLADHDDRFGLRIVVEQLENVEVRRAVDRIAADADTGALPVARGSSAATRLRRSACPMRETTPTLPLL